MVPDKEKIEERRGKGSEVYSLTCSYPLKHVDSPLETSFNFSYYIYSLNLSGQAWKDVALSYYHGAHTGLEETESEGNTQGTDEAGCVWRNVPAERR